jgi:SNF2 family DNA or RNA helicase
MLTATPIQNRLWDLYSLVDLLTVARGHQNPFGSEGMFARKFVADIPSDGARASAARR